MRLTLEQVQAMAPDASSAKAAQKLGAAKAWLVTGHDELSVWGECQGSALYQVRVDRGDWAYKCNCPSRKLPCKHVLGLLTLFSQFPDNVLPATAPEWVSDWLKRRSERAEKKAAKAEAPPKPKDEKAAAKRREQRLQRIVDGVAQLDLWMEDLIRNGLGNITQEGFQIWEQQAARLVDAQAPGLAARVRELGSIPGSGKDWPSRLLAGMGRLALLTHSWQQMDRLDPGLASDIQQLVGLQVSEEDRFAQGEMLADEWCVLGQWIEEGDRIRTRRTWCKGINSNRAALLLHFSVAGQPFGQNLIPGTRWQATLRFWPGAAPVRAEIVEQVDKSESIVQRVAGAANLAEMLDLVADSVARHPFQERFLVVLHDVVPMVLDESWMIRDQENYTIQVLASNHWTLLAMSAGQSLDVFGEWDGVRLRLLGTWRDNRYAAIQMGAASGAFA